MKERDIQIYAPFHQQLMPIYLHASVLCVQMPIQLTNIQVQSYRDVKPSTDNSVPPQQWGRRETTKEKCH